MENEHESAKKTSVLVASGTYLPRGLTFGPTNGPEDFQKLDITKDEKQIRNYLGSFNFKGEKVSDRVNLFSGGEKARLAFAIIAYKKPNLLIMDEPTNHLDAESIDSSKLFSRYQFT